MSNVDTVRWSKRRITDDAQFLVPLLEKGMCVVDAGWGPGAMTRGIAERVAPGWVIGVDTNGERVATAWQLIRASPLQNVRLHVGDATAIPLRERAIAVVFANGLLEHLHAPAVAMAEFFRVLRTGGLVALRSPDWGAVILEPTSPTLLASIALRNRWQRHNRGEPQAGRKLKSLLRTAGFSDSTVRAEAVNEEPAAFGDYLHSILGDPALVVLSERYGWASATDIAAMISAWSAWATSPDAFVSSFWCHAIARRNV
jgi:ubiquinone/menaquinone biosynthesis C-methylase UbiE